MKRTRIILVKSFCDRVQKFKKMSLVILFDILINPSFKLKTGFANVAGTKALVSKFIY